jgi:error-prone DNA polymerase
VGKVLGFDTGEIERLRSLLWHSRGDDLRERLESQPELRALGIDPARYADLFALCGSLAGLPRHRGTHSSGIVVCDVPLASVCPLAWAAKGVPIVTMDKDDVESPGIGLLKMDQLCLRGLTARDIAIAAIQRKEPRFDYPTRNLEDPETLAMIRAAQTVGVFQLESPAQMSLQWRLQSEKFDDLIASVALIRPGPIVGKTVDPYIAYRRGWKRPTYLLPELEPVLAETYGRIIFQDQVLEVVATLAGYTPEEADLWLKAMNRARSEEEVKQLGAELYARARKKGVTGKGFEKIWKQIKGFSKFGFCHGHAVAFASHAQGTAYLLRHYPAEFLAAVLSVEPCGFWPVATITAEAVRRGVNVLPPCLNWSEAKSWTVEADEASATGKAVRCSLAFVESVGEKAADAIVEERQRSGPFTSLANAGQRLWFLGRDAMEWLTLAGAMDIFCGSRRQVLWSLPAIHNPPHKRRPPVPGQETLDLAIAPLLPTTIADFSKPDRFAREWRAMGFSPSGHPMRFYRDAAEKAGAVLCAALQDGKPGQTVTIAGLCLCPHRPPMASEEVFVFFSLEDESGMVQVTVTPDVYETAGAAIFRHPFLMVVGEVKQTGIGKTLRANQAFPFPSG